MLTESVVPVVPQVVHLDKLFPLGILKNAVFISPTEFKIPVDSVEAVDKLRSSLHQVGIYNVRTVADPVMKLVADINLKNYFDDEGGASEHLFHLSMRLHIRVVYAQVLHGFIVIHCTDRASAMKVCTGLNKYTDRSFRIENDADNSLDVFVVTNRPVTEINKAA
jgi:hypothetical protein